MADGGKKRKLIVDLTLIDDDPALVVEQPNEKKRMLLDLTADDDDDDDVKLPKRQSNDDDDNDAVMVDKDSAKPPTKPKAYNLREDFPDFLRAIDADNLLPPRRQSNDDDDNDAVMDNRNVAKPPAEIDFRQYLAAIDDEANQQYEKNENVGPVRQAAVDGAPKEQKRPLIDLTGDSDDDVLPQQRRQLNYNDEDDVPLEDSEESQDYRKANIANKQPARQVANNNQPKGRQQLSTNSDEILLADLVNDFGRLFTEKRQKEIALAMFLNEPVVERERDVKTTENLVDNVALYIPRESDFQGVDTEGSNPRRAPWEGEQNADYRFPRHFTAKGQVRSLAIVYAKAGPKPLMSIPNRPWSIVPDTSVGFTVARLQQHSRLYRSSWLEPWEKNTDKSWFGNLEVALRYNNTHFVGEAREKQIAVFEAPFALELIDMTDYNNVYKMWQMIGDMYPPDDRLRKSFETIFSLRKLTIGSDGKPHAVRNEIFNMHPDVIKMPDGSPIVYRASLLDEDYAFVAWFKKAFGMFHGWCFLHKQGELRNSSDELISEKISYLQGHHDEFYISRPDLSLVRLQYVIADMQKYAPQNSK